jgi:LytS/YehU family sensor histidine kinase
VKNTGSWIESGGGDKAGGVGLQNLRQRLGLLYPDHHSLEILCEEGWVTVRIRIPAAA